MSNLVPADVAVDACGDCWVEFSNFWTDSIPTFFTESVPTFFTETIPAGFQAAWDATALWVDDYVKPFFDDCKVWFEENADWLWPVAVAFVAGAAFVGAIALSCLCCKKPVEGDGSGDDKPQSNGSVSNRSRTNSDVSQGPSEPRTSPLDHQLDPMKGERVTEYSRRKPQVETASLDGSEHGEKPRDLLVAPSSQSNLSEREISFLNPQERRTDQRTLDMSRLLPSGTMPGRPVVLKSEENPLDNLLLQLQSHSPTEDIRRKTVPSILSTSVRRDEDTPISQIPSFRFPQQGQITTNPQLTAVAAARITADLSSSDDDESIGDDIIPDSIGTAQVDPTVQRGKDLIREIESLNEEIRNLSTRSDSFQQSIEESLEEKTKVVEELTSRKDSLVKQYETLRLKYNLIIESRKNLVSAAKLFELKNEDVEAIVRQMNEDNPEELQALNTQLNELLEQTYPDQWQTRDYLRLNAELIRLNGAFRDRKRTRDGEIQTIEKEIWQVNQEKLSLEEERTQDLKAFDESKRRLEKRVEQLQLELDQLNA